MSRCVGRRIYINDGWEFTEVWTDAFGGVTAGRGDPAPDAEQPGVDMEKSNKDAGKTGGDENAAPIRPVRLPHTCKVTPYNYFDESIYQMVCGYRRIIEVPEAGFPDGKRVFLVVEAAGHSADVFLGGRKVGEHHCGYTAFEVELTEFLRPGKNLLAIRVDSREQQDIPPFGYVIDYMTYGGLYRGVYLEVTGETRMKNIFIAPRVCEEETLLEGWKQGASTREALGKLRPRGEIRTEFILNMPEKNVPDFSDCDAQERNVTGLSECDALERTASSFSDCGESGKNIASPSGGEAPELYLRQRVFPYQKEKLRELPLLEKEVPLKECAVKPRKEGSFQETQAGGSLEKKTGGSLKTQAGGSKEEEAGSSTEKIYSFSIAMDDVRLWDVDFPVLYTIVTELFYYDAEGNAVVLDRSTVAAGFRRSQFKADGYYLNGRRLQIIGLNRHQSWPYVGYAMPDSQQKLDADILKKELGLNAVRTSHYPQSQSFCQRCDELGLLVFTEIPGWQHIGDAAWKEQALRNTIDMVIQYRNHPSVILWGVRINESLDNDDLYSRTNRIARELDGTRPTGGVRYLKKSSFLEDVYTYNDFLHDGTNAGCEKKNKVTSDMGRAYLISEYNGHMYPTKAFDSENHIRDHMLRHARVLNDAIGQGDIAGTFGWCMFDYNTHKDFGSGDRICYHGVMDMYRNPKLAASIYAAQQEEFPVLEVSSSMDIGEHPASNPGEIYIISNADEVRMYRGGEYLKSYFPQDSQYRHLAHGPILIDDYIGSRMGREEHFTEKQERDVKKILNYAAVRGYGRLPMDILAAAARLVLLYHMKPGDAYMLFSKYVGNWGGEASGYRFEAVKDGKVVKTIVKRPVQSVHLYANPDHVDLTEGSSYDAASVRIEMRDQDENRLPFYMGSVSLKTRGPIEIIGPGTAQLRGGCGGTYVRTTGETGEAELILENEQAEMVACRFRVGRQL